ncbi:MAG TPA: BamA/TamA family outer membrane protein [Burkholderiaceae bacterium]|nr:BamA/TamA family outer membrane protein [Burkholderiaceae bacterium]
MRVLCVLVALLVFGHQAQARPQVTIDPGGVGPGSLKAITGAVDTITRLAEDQDGGEAARLRRRARDATFSALETQGYFSAKVDLEVGEDIAGETWDIIITPGPRTQVRDVSLEFSGQITLPEFAPRLKTYRDDWPLTKDMPFVNAQWSAAKDDLIHEVRRKDFYLARVTHSRATVRTEDASADLSMAIDSGPRVRMGELRVEGLKRVPRKLIDRYVRYTPGDPYDQDLLDEWQQDLELTTFFRGAVVMLDDDPSKRKIVDGDEVEIPLEVRVTEAIPKRFTASLGVDSDNGVRVEGLYRQNVVFGQPVWMETGIGVDKNRQRAFFDIHLPPTRSGYKDSVGVLVNHTDIRGVDTLRYGLGWKRRQERKAAGNSRVEYETETNLIAAYDRTRIDGAESFRVPSLVGLWQWLRRDVNDKYDPREGNLIVFGLGMGVTLDKGEPFYRSTLRAQHWWPIGKRDVFTIRGEVGKVWAHTSRVPDEFGFRTGGARTIRGYRYRSIGLPEGDAIVDAPTLALASIEYTHYLDDTFGIAAFVDAGDAAERFQDMKWHVGYGLGVRVRSPAGPFSVDLAYGQRDRRVRLQFWLGIAF